MLKTARWATWFAMVLTAMWVAYQVSLGTWLQTDFHTLLPEETRPNAAWQAADAKNEAQINSQVVLLVGNADANRAFEAANVLSEVWRKSGVFAAVDAQIQPNVKQFAQEAQTLSLALMPSAVQHELLNEPERYFQQRAADVANPFAASLLPLEQDWLGFGRFLLQQANPHSQLQWHSETGFLYREDAGKTWVFVRGVLPSAGFAQHAGLLDLATQTRTWASKEKVDVLLAGGALFAAQAKADAERESELMSAVGMTLTFVLLLFVFRSVRVFALLLPLSAGLLFGLAACLLVFGQVHILTLVIGTSLLGMLVDFPLHWLTPALFANKMARRPEPVAGSATATATWRAQDEMRAMLPAFALSLTITVAGYALLWFTPLPVLRQSAVFSVFALLGAFACTTLLLPTFFANYRAKPSPIVAWIKRWQAFSFGTKTWQRLMLLALAILTAGGIAKSSWQDDIRQWLALPSAALSEVQEIGRLSGTEFASQFILLEAASDDELLKQSRQVKQLLQDLVAQQKIGGVVALSDWILPSDEQKQLQQQLRHIAQQPQTWAAMNEIGVPSDIVRQALLQQAEQPTVALQTALNSTLGAAWQSLYIGKVATGKHAAIVRVQNLKDAAAVQTAIAPIAGATWVDKRAHLNRLFEDTRDQAAWLKLLSFVAAWLVLAKLFGIKKGSKIMCVPLLAMAATVASLAFLGLPISLFAMFGLLLVAAVGVDYAVYATVAPHSPSCRLAGMLFAALTSLISFALLSMSSTRAVASFGISVALGVVYVLLLAKWLLLQPTAGGTDKHNIAH